MRTVKSFRAGAAIAVLVGVATLVASSALAAPSRTLAAPTITSFNPTSGAVGTFVTIVGTNLTSVSVAFNKGGLAATTPANAEGTVNTATEITTLVPAGAPWSAQVHDEPSQWWTHRWPWTLLVNT